MRKQNCNFAKFRTNQARTPKNKKIFYMLCVSWCFAKKRRETLGTGPHLPYFWEISIFFYDTVPNLFPLVLIEVGSPFLAGRSICLISASSASPVRSASSATSASSARSASIARLIIFTYAPLHLASLA